ncbi:MAG: hypothetical protein ACTSXX_02445 [Candidatus Baldrarchaeia archaeon]
MVKITRVIPSEEYQRRYVQKCLLAYLRGERNLNWLIGVIRSTSIRGEELREIFKELSNKVSDRQRYESALKECERQGIV